MTILELIEIGKQYPEKNGEVRGLGLYIYSVKLKNRILDDFPKGWVISRNMCLYDCKEQKKYREWVTPEILSGNMVQSPIFKNWAPIIFAYISISIFTQEVETTWADDFQTDLKGKWSFLHCTYNILCVQEWLLCWNALSFWKTLLLFSVVWKKMSYSK